jgi:hypothetical protein
MFFCFFLEIGPQNGSLVYFDLQCSPQTLILAVFSTARQVFHQRLTTYFKRGWGGEDGHQDSKRLLRFVGHFLTYL